MMRHSVKELYEKHSVGGSLNLATLYDEVASFPEPERKATARDITEFCNREIVRLTNAKSRLLQRRDFLGEQVEEMHDLMEWLAAPLRLEKPDGCSIHQLRQALRDKRAFLLTGLDDEGHGLSGFDAALHEANCFVVEHDWSKAFDGATDFANGEIRLPYENCAFDLRISGRRVIALMTTDPDANDILMQVMVRGSRYWMLDDDICRHTNGVWMPIGAGRSPETNKLQGLAEFIGGQVRAITIALDAEVAETEVIRVPEKLARAREKAGKAPLKPYHVVSLCKRSRAAPAPTTGEGEHGRKRLHFRRGHWRHYEAHKTWIRWMLVGDPDLGFVEKEYRL